MQLADQYRINCEDPATVRAVLQASNPTAATALRAVADGRIDTLLVRDLIEIVPALTDDELDLAGTLGRTRLDRVISDERKRRYCQQSPEQIADALGAGGPAALTAALAVFGSCWQGILLHASRQSDPNAREWHMATIRRLAYNSEHEGVIARAIISGDYPPLTGTDIGENNHTLSFVGAALRDTTVIDGQFARGLVAMPDYIDSIGWLFESLVEKEHTLTDEAAQIFGAADATPYCRLLACTAGIYDAPTMAATLIDIIRQNSHLLYLYEEHIAQLAPDTATVTTLWTIGAEQGAGSCASAQTLVHLYQRDAESCRVVIPQADGDDLAGFAGTCPAAIDLIVELVDEDQCDQVIEHTADNARWGGGEGNDLARQLLLHSPGAATRYLAEKKSGKAYHSAYVTGLFATAFGTDTNAWTRYFALAPDWTGSAASLIDTIALMDSTPTEPPRKRTRSKRT